MDARSLRTKRIDGKRQANLNNVVKEWIGREGVAGQQVRGQ